MFPTKLHLTKYFHNRYFDLVSSSDQIFQSEKMSPDSQLTEITKWRKIFNL